MSRELKFRIYHKLRGGDKVVVTHTSFEELEGEDSWQGPTPWERLQVCQYTGLKDANGREIYEGDILEYQSNEYPDEEGDRYTVEWRVKEFIGVWEGDKECKNRDNDGLRGSTSDIVVIGNIYENPELLK